MAEAKTARVKYVFLDIVGYTKGRSVDDQLDVISYLNRIVFESLEAQHIKQKDRVVLCTGDGMCIALIQVRPPLDIHLSLGLQILKGIYQHNEGMPCEPQQFQVRIGLNENDDNIITDFNGKKSVAGAGINTAERIMANGEGGHILVSQAVCSSLQPRRKYSDCFRECEFLTKHNEKQTVFQYIGTDEQGLNKNPPPKQALQHAAAVKAEFFDPAKFGNIFWVGHDLVTTMVFLLTRHSRERILEGLYQSRHHLSEVGFHGTAVHSRLEKLYTEAAKSSESDWTDERRQQVAQKLEHLARELGGIIAPHQIDFKSHPTQ